MVYVATARLRPLPRANPVRLSRSTQPPRAGSVDPLSPRIVPRRDGPTERFDKHLISGRVETSRWCAACRATTKNTRLRAGLPPVFPSRLTCTGTLGETAIENNLSEHLAPRYSILHRWTPLNEYSIPLSLPLSLPLSPPLSLFLSLFLFLSQSSPFPFIFSSKFLRTMTDAPVRCILPRAKKW